MSAALSHLTVGLLLGLAVRLRLRYLPAAAFLALLPDLDHVSYLPFPVPFLETRVTFHNLFFCVALPLLVFALVAWKSTNPDLRRLAAAAPLLMSSHLFLDTLPLDVSSPRVPLFFPFSRDLYTFAAIRGYAVDPTAYSTITLLLLILSALAVVTVLAVHLGERPHRARWPRFAIPAVHVVVWILVFPGLAAGGFVIPAPRHPDAILALEDPTLLVPQGRVTAVVYHLGGNDAAKGSVRVGVYDGDTRVSQSTSPQLLTKGDRWVVEVQLPANAPREVASLEVRVMATADNHTYVTKEPLLRRSHVPTSLAIAAFQHDARGRATLRIANDGAAALPAGAFGLLVTAGSNQVLNITNPDAVGPGATWTTTITVPVGLNQASHTIVATATDDGYVYLRESRTPTLSPVATPAFEPTAGIPGITHTV